MKFIDTAKFKITAGKGGDGAVVETEETEETWSSSLILESTPY
jgi:GTPase involved in cell partitioning and DNA repair